MSSNLSTIQPLVDAMLKQFAVLPTLAIDTTSHVSQFVQQLLSNTGFFAATLTSGGKPQVVVMNFSFYEKIYELVSLLPKMFSEIQLHKAVAAGSAKQLDRNIIWLALGTWVAINGVSSLTRSLIPSEVTPRKDESSYRLAVKVGYALMTLAGISAVVYSAVMTHKVARALQGMA